MKEERVSIASKVRNLLDTLAISYAEVVERSEQYENNLTSSNEDEADHPVLADILKELISYKRKFRMIGNFLVSFFGEGSELVDRMPETDQLCKNIDERVAELMSVWDSKSKEIVEEIKMEMEDRNLVELDIDVGSMTTNFPDSLVDLIHYVGVFAEMGFEAKISKEIKVYVQTQKGIYTKAVKLRKISDFYNTLVDLDSVLLKCHKPLLMDKVIDLENLVQTKSHGLEQDERLLGEFISEAEHLIELFNNLNSKLKGAHNKIISDFVSLYDKDLVTNRIEWKRVVQAAKSSVGNIAKEIEVSQLANIHDPEKRNKQKELFQGRKTVWTNYLSWQLLKVLIHQLKRSLLKVSDFIPKIEAKALLSRGKIIVSPAIPQIRAKVYDYINSMIGFPKSLEFFNNWNNFLEFIPTQSKKCLRLAYAEADRVITVLDRKMIELREWVALANLDPEKIVNNKRMNTGEIWKKIVETLREKRRELERQEDYIDADCVTLSIGNFKMQVEDEITRVLSSMMGYLEKSLTDEHSKVKEFLAEMTQRLDHQPKSADELSKATQQFRELQERTKEFKPTIDSLKGKIELIMSLGRTQTKSGEVIEEWERFDLRVKNFKQELKQKQQNMRQEMQNQVMEMSTELRKFESKWESSKLRQDEEINRKIAKDYLTVLKSIQKSWGERQEELERLKKDLEYFEMDGDALELGDLLKSEIDNEVEEWKIIQEFEQELSALEERKHVGNTKTIFDFQDMMVEWQNKVKRNTSRVGAYLNREIDIFQSIWSGLKLMIGEAFQREHWNSLMFILGLKNITMDKLKFGDLIKNPNQILTKMPKLRELSARAQGEVTIREAIEELDNWCNTAEFELTSFTDTKKSKVPLIKEWNEMMSKVGDNQALLQSIKDSKFYSRFKDRIAQFDKRIGGLDSYLTKIQTIQRRWLYLEPIFGKGALPSQQERFDNLNNQFQGIMRNIEKMKKIALMNEISGLDKSLDTIIEQLEICQSALNKFLEETRNRFPRFFFLGDDDLLEILGQSDNPRIIKMHLKKIFAGIHDVEFKQAGSGLEIVSMIASCGETVALKQKVPVGGNLEVWLRALAKQMLDTLQESLIRCMKEKSFSISNYPGQILSVSKQIEFTNRVVDGKKENFKDLEICQKFQFFVYLATLYTLLSLFIVFNCFFILGSNISDFFHIW